MATERNMYSQFTVTKRYFKAWRVHNKEETASKQEPPVEKTQEASKEETKKLEDKTEAVSCKKKNLF